jgi:hypothetical protein
MNFLSFRNQQLVVRENGVDEILLIHSMYLTLHIAGIVSLVPERKLSSNSFVLFFEIAAAFLTQMVALDDATVKFEIW